MPTYNTGRILSESIDSILAQTYPNFELLIADDKSDDEVTLSILKHYEQKDSRIKIVYLDENRGAGYARNKAIEAAIGALEATVTDATPLTEALAEAEAISPDIYTDESLQRMRQTVTEAERVAATPQSQVEIDRQAYLVRQAAAALDAASQVDKSTLKELMQIAAARIKAEQTWQALEVKVPEFAPWAPHGYSRLTEQYARAEEAYHNHGRRYSQTEVDKVAADLNAAINTMRPGNLAELEDLGTLLRAVEQAETMPDTPQRREAIEYARMVVKYVSDGSGTLDMIRDAETKIAAVLK